MNINNFIPAWIKEIIDYIKTKKHIPSNVILNKTAKIYPGVIIGDYSLVNGNSRIFTGTIGKYCSIGYNVQISPPEHPIEWASTSQVFYKRTNWNEVFKPVDIGNDVWIGSNSVVLSGVKIGTGAVIAVGAVVTHNVDPYTIVGGGNPRSQLKYDFQHP